MTPSRSLNIPVLLLLGASLAGAPAHAQTPSSTPVTEGATAPANAQVVEDIVARVNDQVITQSDYDRAMEQLRAEAAQQGVPPQDLEAREHNLLRDLIDKELLLSKGKELDITGEAELVRRLDDVRKENHLDSMEDLEKAAQAQGVSYEDFKANIRNGIITQEVIRDEVSRHVQLSQGDEQAFFQAHQSEFAQPESVHLEEILIATPADDAADSPKVTDARQQADSLEEKLKGGASFEDLAKADSSGPAADRGGDLGEFRRGMLAKQLEDATFSLQGGQFTEPIRTKQGYIILKVVKHTQAGVASFKDVQPQVEEALFEERLQPALREYLTKQREAAYIDIKPGFTDTAASPDEIHPSYSAYTPPGPKKKKKFARVRFRGKTPAAASPSSNQAASKAAPATSTPASATGSKPAPQAVASKKSASRPGKKEKIRFGQAPQDTLTSAQNGPASTSAGTGTQTASSASPDIPAVNAGSPIGDVSQLPEKEQKTRFSQRPSVPKVKKPKGSSEDATAPANAPTQDELAAQKVQDAPLGLAPQPAKTKKKKQKGDKTRFTGKPKQPEQVQQPYMGGQQPVDGNPSTSAAQPAAGAGNDQPPSTAPDGIQH